MKKTIINIQVISYYAALHTALKKAFNQYSFSKNKIMLSIYSINFSLFNKTVTSSIQLPKQLL